MRWALSPRNITPIELRQTTPSPQIGVHCPSLGPVYFKPRLRRRLREGSSALFRWGGPPSLRVGSRTGLRANNRVEDGRVSRHASNFFFRSLSSRSPR